MSKIIRILRSCFMKIFSKFPTVNISKLHYWLVICIAKNLIWTTLKMIFSIFRFFLHPFKYCPIINHTMEILCVNLNLEKRPLMTGFVVPGSLMWWRWRLTERLVDGEKGLHDEHGRSHDMRLLKDMASFSVQHAVDAADHLLWTLREGETRAGERRSGVKEEESQWRGRGLTWISTRYTGSMSRGSAVSWQAYRTLRAVGMIWPPPRWMASVWRVTSWTSKRTPRMFSSHSTPWAEKPNDHQTSSWRERDSASTGNTLNTTLH